MKCIDKKGHDYAFVGFMVVAEKLEEEKQTAQVSGGTPPQGAQISWFPAGTSVPYYVMPKQFPAKIEVHQCRKCGDVCLKPAVFSRL